MDKTTMHLCADIRGMLNNHTRKGSLKGYSKTKTGVDCLTKKPEIIYMTVWQKVGR